MVQYLSITVHPNAGKDVLVSLGAGRFEAWVKAKPVGGRANEALVALLARNLRVSPRGIQLIKGRSGRRKVFKISE
jgi:uncharacterized protein (TIGR00251 family)